MQEPSFQGFGTAASKIKQLETAGAVVVKSLDILAEQANELSLFTNPGAVTAAFSDFCKF
jgi:hypothetical protein